MCINKILDPFAAHADLLFSAVMSISRSGCCEMRWQGCSQSGTFKTFEGRCRDDVKAQDAFRVLKEEEKVGRRTQEDSPLAGRRAPDVEVARRLGCLSRNRHRKSGRTRVVRRARRRVRSNYHTIHTEKVVVQDTVFIAPGAATLGLNAADDLSP